MRSRVGVSLRDSCSKCSSLFSIVHRDEDGGPRQLSRQGKASLCTHRPDDFKEVTTLSSRINP